MVHEKIGTQLGSKRIISVMVQKWSKYGPRKWGASLLATISPVELSSMGTGGVLQAQKIYAPRMVLDYLSLSRGDQLEYFQILDPNYRNVILIKKKS